MERLPSAFSHVARLPEFHTVCLAPRLSQRHQIFCEHCCRLTGWKSSLRAICSTVASRSFCSIKLERTIR